MYRSKCLLFSDIYSKYEKYSLWIYFLTFLMSSVRNIDNVFGKSSLHRKDVPDSKLYQEFHEDFDHKVLSKIMGSVLLKPLCNILSMHLIIKREAIFKKWYTATSTIISYTGNSYLLYLSFCLYFHITIKWFLLRRLGISSKSVRY